MTKLRVDFFSISLDGYGAGRIERLAEERGFLVVSPLSYVFTEAPESITLLIERIAAEYPVDASRVYLIGHSLGAVAASRIIETEPDLFAGCVCFSGGRAFAPGAELPPLLYMQGALDPIMAPSRTRTIVDALRAAGKENVELREFENVGHTLIVNDQLGAAVDWLLARKR